ncbi:MAG: ISLre2 family transposase [Clostridia bacterium]|uniref:ISLre2 family transposase n=1 Tax=Dubosiella newyorkensis TaxID=1862672 RepID=UPI0025ABF555|nr:ISLre2 family transposase [Dubosiella newyorkensis]MCI8411809.1 ISLre2 family transposase [Clostridia bacterium]
MINIIIQTIIENKEKIEKSLKRSIEEGEISLFSQDLRKVFDEAGRKTLVGILEMIDTTLFESSRRRLEYETKDLRKRTLLTEYGNIEYLRRYYKNKITKEYVYLADEKMGIEKNERMTKDVESKIIELSHDISYKKSGKQAVREEVISPTTIMKKVRKEELKVETKEENKEVKILYIEADEDHVSERGNKIGMPKLVYIHEGNQRIGKRNILKNIHYIGCLGKRSEELWIEVAEYIDKKYDVDKIERVYIGGDGAKWIKEGLNWIKNSKFVLDRFHLLKYVNQATVEYPEYRSKIWYNLNIYDPVSIENIFKEILEKTIDEKRREKVYISYKYIMNQWEGIEIYETEGENLKGCSAEGHISHVYADRMSSRPRTWSDDGIDKMSRLRTFKSNGGNIYKELLKRKKENTKLKKYDKIIERNIKKGICIKTGIKIPLIESGINSRTRDILKDILYA